MVLRRDGRSLFGPDHHPEVCDSRHPAQWNYGGTGWGAVVHLWRRRPFRRADDNHGGRLRLHSSDDGPDCLERTILTGSDGNLWIPSGSHMVIASPSGIAYELGDSIGSIVCGMTMGPDGAIWMVNTAIGRLTTPGGFPPTTLPKYSQFPVGSYITPGIITRRRPESWDESRPLVL